VDDITQHDPSDEMIDIISKFFIATGLDGQHDCVISQAYTTTICHCEGRSGKQRLQDISSALMESDNFKDSKAERGRRTKQRVSNVKAEWKKM
jgi:hypothetical protein